MRSMFLVPKPRHDEKPPLFMVCQLPFQAGDCDELNVPQIEKMDDVTNARLGVRNLKELGVYNDVKRSDRLFVEIGCGGGHLLAALRKEREPNETVWLFGLEPILQQVKVARANNPDVIIYHGGVEACDGLLQEVRGKADYAYSNHVIEHLVNPLELLQQAKRLLRPGGRLITVCPNVEGWVPSRDLEGWRCTIRAHRWLPGKSTLFRAMRGEGYEVEEWFTYGGYPAPRKWWQGVANQLFKMQGLGDVICIMARLL